MKTEKQKRVFVTGLGMVTALGSNAEQSFKRIVAGEDGIGDVTLFDVSGCRCKRAGEVRFQPESKTRRLSRVSQLLLPAVRESLENANLLTAQNRCSLSTLPMSISTTGGGMPLGESFLKRAVQKKGGGRPIFEASNYQPQAQVVDIHQTFGFRGPVTVIANACASGANAIGHASDMIRSGMADCVLTGGYEALAELIFVGFDCLQALTTEQCRPFDLNRSGLVLGEAAAFLILESENSVKNRKAKILCELSGYGHSTDLHHLTQPDPTGAAQLRAMKMAFEQSGICPSEIGYVNAHGTGTKINDVSEAAVYEEFFNGHSVRVSSTKAAVGHTLGAAGAVEAILSILALLQGKLPPQKNLVTPEPAVKHRLVKVGEQKKFSSSMSVNLGFGGSNAALIFSKIS
jgi:3-oxoacyl-[acyl-carrier-protein] synthase II